MTILPPLARQGSERGQVVALFVMALVCLIGISALVLDVGAWYLTDHRAQAAADAAALAAAERLPYTPTASALNGDGAALNQANWAYGEMDYVVSSSPGAGSVPDTVRTIASGSAPGFFAKVFGIDSVGIEAQAEAQVQTYLGWGLTTLPWAIDEPHLQFGVPMHVKVEDPTSLAPGNFGALDLVKVPGCSSSNGAQNYEGMISGDNSSCGLMVGGPVAPKTGNMAGPTETGLQERGVVHPFDWRSIYQPDGHGGMVITQPDHPNVGVLPIVRQFFNGASRNMTIVSFEYFIITDYGKTSGKAWVDGVFVRASNRPSEVTCPTPTNAMAPCPTGTYTSERGISAIRLTA